MICFCTVKNSCLVLDERSILVGGQSGESKVDCDLTSTWLGNRWIPIKSWGFVFLPHLQDVSTSRTSWLMDRATSWLSGKRQNCQTLRCVRNWRPTQSFSSLISVHSHEFPDVPFLFLFLFLSLQPGWMQSSWCSVWKTRPASRKFTRSTTSSHSTGLSLRYHS